MTLSSTTILNFINFTGYFSPFISFAQKENNGDFSQIDLGLEFGGEVKFWKRESEYPG